MRRLLCCTVPRWGLTLAGLAAVTVAVAAWHLGLDNNPVIGPRRILLLLCGIGILWVVHRGRLATLLRRAGPQLDRPSPTHALAPDRTLTDPHRADIHRAPRSPWPALSLILPAIFALYLYLGTAGEWTKPPLETTLYYDMLADAFASGQTFLKPAPDPRLAQLQNPYDPAQRAMIPRCSPGTVQPDCLLWDASYFDGKYYLYWGPAPALALAVLKLAGLGRIGDSAIALIGAGGLFCLLAYCVVDLWHRFFSRLPGWLLFPPVVLAGLAYPLPWVLDAPRIYEAAILAGASFLMAGLVTAIPVLASGHCTPKRLALVGVLWGLSFGSRTVLALPIALLAAGTAWRVFRTWSGGSRRESILRPLGALALPLLTAMILIGAYNFDRFSDPMEFGLRYMIGPPALQSAGTQATFDWRNVPANAYNYLFAPASITQQFPFVEPRLPTEVISLGALGPIRIAPPDFFYVHPITGLAVSTPFLVFAGYLLWRLMCGSIDRANSSKGPPTSGSEDESGLHGLAGILFLAALAAFIPILSFYGIAARYLLDVSPLLTILASLGAWTAYATAARTQLTRWLMGAAIVVSGGASGVVSVLLALNNWSR